MPFWTKAYDGIVERETENSVIVIAYRVERDEITLNFRLLIGTIITKYRYYADDFCRQVLGYESNL